MKMSWTYCGPLGPAWVATLLAVVVACHVKIALAQNDNFTTSDQVAMEPANVATSSHASQSELNTLVASGRALFEGQGHCAVCHSIGRTTERGRGPDLAGIGSRASERAAHFKLQGPDAATRYLIRSIIHPKDDVVENFNAAPESWLPSDLSNDNIRDLVVYLQSLSGKPDPEHILLPEDWLAAKREEYHRELILFSFGDPESGREMFHDPKGKAACIKCHTINGKGQDICPNLSFVNRVQRPSYVLESILDSSAFVVHGYQQMIILDDNGLTHTGLVKEENEETITLIVDQEGRTEVVRKDEIDEQFLSKVSQMPGNFSEQLTAKQIMDLVAYVTRHNKPEPKELAEQQTRIRPETASGPSLDVFGKVTEDQQRYRMAMERGDPVIGSRIYAHYCTMCHGTDGTGTGFNATNLPTKPANHTDNRRMSKTEDLLLRGVISRGGMKTGRSFLMPPWGGSLSERDTWDLVAYLRTLHSDVKHKP